MNVGQWGEKLAQAYYEENGYFCVQKNYRVRFGEIDLIMEKDGQLVFVEVKTRSQSSFARPAAFVCKKKQEKIQKTALFYLQEQALCDVNMRFDVIEVYKEPNGNGRIVCIENAF